VQQLKAGEFSVAELKSAGFDVGSLLAGGCSVSELKNVNFTASQMKNAGCSVQQLKREFALAELRAATFDVAALLSAGFILFEMRIAGFSASSLKAAGCGAEKLKGAGFTASDLRDAGFDLVALDQAGYTTEDLKNAKFTDAEISKTATFASAETAMRAVRVCFDALTALGAGHALDQQEAEDIAGKDNIFKRIQIRAATDDFVHALRHPAIAKNISTAQSLRALGVRAYCLHAAGFAQPILAAAEYSKNELDRLQLSFKITSGPIFFYKNRKTLTAALLMALTSMSIGLLLRDVISMVVLVVCLPTVSSFVALWKCMSTDNPKDLVKWAFGFFAYCAAASALSVGIMLGTQHNRLEPYGLQAALMIFAVCVPIVFCFALHYAHWSSKNIYRPYPFQWKLGFALSFAFIFTLVLILMIALPTRPRDISFSIPAFERKAGKTAVFATLGFTPSIFGGVKPGGTITLTYPDSFFMPSVTPVVPVGGSNVAGLTATCGATTATSVVITTSGAAIPSFFFFTVTLNGFRLGTTHAGSLSITVQTSSDTLASPAVESGSIIRHNMDLAFSIASTDRKAGKTAVPVTFGFMPLNVVPAGGTITLRYPDSFFMPSVTPVVPVGGSNVAGLTATCGATTATSVVITTSGAAIPASAFIITLKGFTMGGLTNGSSGVAVQTSADLLPSAAVHSGALLHPIWDVYFNISAIDRKAGKTSVPVTLGFTAANPVPAGGTITLTYPDSFFMPSVTPVVPVGGSNVAGLTATCGATTATSVVITTSGAAIPASSFVVTISGFFNSNIVVRPGMVYVRTSSHQSGSDGVSSGFIAVTGSLVLNLTGHIEGVWSVAWSPDGSKIATASLDDTARVFSSSSGSTLLTLTGHSDWVRSVAWSPDGSNIATASDDRTARVWSSSNGSTLLTLEGHSQFVWSVAWSPDGSKIATASDDGTARVWSSSGRTQLNFKVYIMRVTSVAWSPDGSKIATSSAGDGVYVFNSSSTFTRPGCYESSPTLRQRSYYCSSVTTLTRLQNCGYSCLNDWCAYSGDSHCWWCSVCSSPCFDFYPDKMYDSISSRCVSYGSNNLQTLTGHSESVNSVAWSPDGSKIATASNDGTARVWSSSNGSTLLTLTGHSNKVTSVAWSPDGSKIATVSFDGTARVWSSSNGSTLLTLTGQSDYAWSVAWSPDGSKIATASFGVNRQTDNIVRVWYVV
jgi:WD40 repeat protein